MKTICIVNFNIYALLDSSSEAAMGGAELDMWVLARALKKKGYTVRILTGDWGQDKILKKENIEIYRSFKMNRGFWNYLRAPGLLFCVLKKINADIYITTSASPEVGLIAFFARCYKKRFIYRTAHDIDCDGTYIKSNGIRGWLYKYGLERADKIVVSVRNHQLLLKVTHKTLKDISFIPLGLDTGHLAGSVAEKNKEYILWVARCEEWKQPYIFLDLATEMPLFKFVMICPMQGHNQGYFNEIKNRAKSLENVTFIDFVPFKDIQPFFDKAKIFVNTSQAEGFTYTLIQSGLAATPVVYLNVDPDDVIKKNNIGFFSENNLFEMRKQLSILMRDSSNWKEKSDNIQEYVVKEHSMDLLGTQWFNLINKIR